MSIKNPSDLNEFNTDASLVTQASYSSIGLHRKCPQAWYYRYGMRLERDSETSPYLTIGRWWSVLRAVEVLERGRAAGSLAYVPRDIRDKDEGIDLDPLTATVSDVLKAAAERWNLRTQEPERELFLEKLGATLPQRLESMYSIWHQENPDRFVNEIPLGAEVFFKRELPRPDGDLAWSLVGNPEAVPKMNLIGYIDELYIDKRRNMVVVRDHKAPSDLGNATSAMDDLMDSQLQVYAWGITPKLKRDGYSVPRAVAYDRTRSVASPLPQLTAAGALSKAVTAYDLNTYLQWAQEDTRPSANAIQAIVDEALNDGKPLSEEQVDLMESMEPGRLWGKLGEFFVSGAKKGQPKFGTYQIDPKEVDRLSGPSEKHRWHTRSVAPVNSRMVLSHLRAAVDTAMDIYQTQLRAAATGEAARNLDRRGCQQCDFNTICRAQLFGGPEGEYDFESLGLRQKPERSRRKPTTEDGETTDDTAG